MVGRGCDKCGAPLGEGDRYCMRCGAAVRHAGNAASLQSHGTVVERSKADGDSRESVSSRQLEPRGDEGPAGNEGLGKGKHGLLSGLISGWKSQGATNDANDRKGTRGKGPGPVDQPDKQGKVTPDDGRTVAKPGKVQPYFKRHRTGEYLYFTCPAVLGKGSKATCLIAGNRGISREHVRITSGSRGFLIEDLDSLNGTWVNEVQLAPGSRQPIESGASVTLADEEFTFYVDR